jgi:hypothetical protein
MTFVISKCYLSRHDSLSCYVSIYYSSRFSVPIYLSTEHTGGRQLPVCFLITVIIIIMLISTVLLKRVPFCLNCEHPIFRRPFTLYVNIVFLICLSSIPIIPLWFHASFDSYENTHWTAVCYRQFCSAARGAECCMHHAPTQPRVPQRSSLPRDTGKQTRGRGWLLRQMRQLPMRMRLCQHVSVTVSQNSWPQKPDGQSWSMNLRED